MYESDRLIFTHPDTGKVIRSLGIPSFDWGNTLYDFYHLGTVIDQNPYVFRKDGNFSIRKISRLAKEENPVYLFTYTNTRGETYKVSILVF
jgi:hypothetical protein